MDEDDTLHNKVYMKISRKNSQMWSFGTLILVELLQILLATVYLDGVIALELNILPQVHISVPQREVLPSSLKHYFKISSDDFVL